LHLQDIPSLLNNTKGWPWNYELLHGSSVLPGGKTWPKISIVTPSLNQGRYLEEAIRSVLLQGYPNLEYIIIDGGSTDESLSIIKKYQPWITYWVSEEDRGQSHAINKGFTKATGDIFAWLNSDDVYQENALVTVAQALAGKCEALLVGDSIITDGPDRLSGRVDRRRPSWEEMAYDARSFPQPSVFWTRDLWDLAGPLNEELYYVMDYDLWLRMRPHAVEEIFLDHVLSYARSHPEQKGAGVKLKKNHELFTRQRVWVAIRSAKSRGESAYTWLIRIWGRRFISAIKNKSFSWLSGSVFHREAFRQVIKGGMDKGL
jgi:glycosyltransferase involved in cell wall biosynthesis